MSADPWHLFVHPEAAEALAPLRDANVAELEEHRGRSDPLPKVFGR